MSLEYKKKNYKKFIESESFTISTFTQLLLFRRNINALYQLINSETKLLDDLLTSEDKTNSFEKNEKIGFIHLDIMSKVMMMIEGLSALLFALSKGKKR